MHARGRERLLVATAQGRLLSGPDGMTSVPLDGSRPRQAERTNPRSFADASTRRRASRYIHFLRRGGAMRARIQGVPGVSGRLGADGFLSMRTLTLVTVYLLQFSASRTSHATE